MGGKGADEDIKKRILELKEKRFGEYESETGRDWGKRGLPTGRAEQQQQGTDTEKEEKNGGDGMKKGFLEPAEDEDLIMPPDASLMDETPMLGETSHFDSLYQDWLRACTIGTSSITNFR